MASGKTMLAIDFIYDKYDTLRGGRYTKKEKAWITAYSRGPRRGDTESG